MNDWDPLMEKPRPDHVRVCGIDLRAGDRVRLWPRRKADILDIAMEGKIATIESIEQDYEDRTFFAVTLDEDPGKDLGTMRKIAHRFFFAADEVEPWVGREGYRE